MIRIITEDKEAIYERAELYGGLDKRIDNLILDSVKSICDELGITRQAKVYNHINMGLPRSSKNDNHGYIIKLPDVAWIKRFMEAWNETPK